MFTTICAIGGGVCFLFVAVVVVIVVAALAFRTVKKSNDKGVVFRDGLSSEETEIVLGVISESFTNKRISEVLAKTQAAIVEAIASRPK